MKYKLIYDHVSDRMLETGELSELGIRFVHDLHGYIFAVITEEQAIILKLKYPRILITEYTEL